jgi:hypothetical protein
MRKKRGSEKLESLKKTELHPTNETNNGFRWIGALVSAGSFQPNPRRRDFDMKF